MNTPTNTRDPKKAEALYQEALKDSPQCRAAMVSITVLVMRDRNYQRANEYNENLIRNFPNDEMGLYNNGTLLMEWKRDYAAAASVFGQLIAKQGPGNGNLYYKLAQAHSLMNKPDSSLAFLANAMSIEKIWGSKTNAQIEPNLENIRKDPKFWALVNR